MKSYLHAMRYSSLMVTCAATALTAGTAAAQTTDTATALTTETAAVQAAETAVAQNEPTAQPVADDGEIVVTARRIEENIQNVPIAITALSSKRLEESGGTTVADLGNMAPSVHFNSISPINGSSNTPNINIRGIGTTDFLLTIDPSVGVYVDGVYVSRTVGGLFDLLDLERVEILRGPQGTLFGRNTIGGAVQLVSRKPSKELRASSEVTVGSYDRFDLRGALSGPLANNLYASIAFSRKTQDGYGNRRDYYADHPEDVGLRERLAAITLFDERTATLISGNTIGLAPGTQLADGKIVAFPDDDERPGNVNNWSTRASLLFEPSDRVSFYLIGDYAKTNEASPALVLLNTFQDDLSAPTPGVVNPLTGNEYAINLAGLHNILYGANGSVAQTVDFNNENFVIGDNYSNYDTGPGASKSEVWGVSFTGEIDLSSALQFKSITAYRSLDSLFGQDAEHSPIVLDAHTNAINQHQFSQEVQVLGDFGRLTGVAGAYYFTEKGTDRVIVPLLEGLAAIDETNDTDNRSIALFTQGTYRATDALSVTGGIRYTGETKDYDQIHLDCGIANALGVPPTAIVNNCYSLTTGSASRKFNNVSYLANVSYRFNENVMAYASYSTGFKSGGYTGRTTAYVPSQEPIPFDPEFAKSFEIGAKTNFRGVRLNAAAFTTSYKGIQLVVQEGIAPITINGGDARIRGAELEAQFRPLTGLTIDGTVSLLDAKYVTERPFGIGKHLPNTPKFSTNLAVAYRVPLASDSTLSFFTNASYKSRVFINSENTKELIQNQAFDLNASVKWSSRGDRYSLTVGGRNLTDEANLISGFFQPGVGYTEGVYNRPRHWYATAGFKF